MNIVEDMKIGYIIGIMCDKNNNKLFGECVIQQQREGTDRQRVITKNDEYIQEQGVR